MGATVGSAVDDLLMPVTAGALVYIACPDLIPEVKRDRRLCSMLVQAPLIALDVDVMAALALKERASKRRRARRK